MSKLPWCSTSTIPHLDSNLVHVWRQSLDQPLSKLACLWQLLTPGERERAYSFHFEVDRRRFIAGRGLLKQLLARYTGVSATELEFSYNNFGKPFLSPQITDIQFNVSHSAGLALYAIAHRRPLGVDLEQIRWDMNYEPLAYQFFHEQEVEALLSLDTVSKRHAFFQGWSCKEAYIKARGEGLSIPLNSFAVYLSPIMPGSHHLIKDVLSDTVWSIQRLTPAVGFVGAIVTLAGDWELQCWQWNRRAAL